MSGMELFSEGMENMENTGAAELLGQRAELQAQLEEAQAAGNLEKANYYNGEIAELDKELAATGHSGIEPQNGGEISFGKSAAQLNAEQRARESIKNGSRQGYNYWRNKAIDFAVKEDLKKEIDKKEHHK